MDNKLYLFEYEFILDSGEVLLFPIQIHPRTLNLISPIDEKPEWAELKNHRCECCSLDGSIYSYCPAALNIVSFIKKSSEFNSFDWCKASYRPQFFESSELPSIQEIDLLVVMGGPMSIKDEHEYPWLALEKKFIRDVIESGKPVLGICLGAQVIASAMGVNVYQNPLKEIGWFPVQGVSQIDTSTFHFPSLTEVFHWHGETFDLPPKAIRIARSEGCENQAFQIGTSVIGLQFHLETTPESAREIVSECRDELIPSQYVQTEEEILSTESASYNSINKLMSEVLSFLQRKKE